MRQAYLIHQSLDEFSAAREQFSGLVEALQSEPNLRKEHSDIEELIWQDGKELLRRMLQGHLDLRPLTGSKRPIADIAIPLGTFQLSGRLRSAATMAVRLKLPC